jgi:putative phosphoribosyl transferase
MTLTESFVVNDRKHAGRLLSEKLQYLKNDNAVVIAVSHGAAVVAYHLADALQLEFDVALCRTIPHPADSRKTIGSICAEEVSIHGDAYDIPRDYIYHQVVLNQNALKSQKHFYKNKQTALSVTGRTVILVGDSVTNVDSILASLNYIQKQHPEKIIIAAGVITHGALAQLSIKVDDIVFISVENDIHATSFYKTHCRINDEDVQDLVLMSSN